MFRSTATGLASRLAVLGGLACAALLGGCADLMQRSTIAPEWFQAKAVEVKGEGYPDLAEIPEMRPSTADQAEWDKAAVELNAASAKLEKELANAEPIPTEEEVRARAAQLRAILENGTSAQDGGQP
jgi:hypothetical protein